MPTPYLPPRDADFAIWLANFSTKITAVPANYGLIAGDAVIIAAQNTAFQAAFLAATTPATRTAATVAAKDAARVLAEAVARPYATAISRNPAVTDANKANVGVTLPDPSRTPIPAPVTAPVLSVRAMIPGQVTIDYRDATDPTARAKPDGVVGMQLFAVFGTVPAVSADALSFIGQVTKTPTLLDSTGQSGKVLTMAGRWVTRAGPGGMAQNGPWSALVSTYVP